MGMLSWSKMRELTAALDLVDLNPEYVRLRMRKSDEEIQWMRIGAALSDLGIEALARGAKPGMTERELGALVEREYHALGGATTIHFIGINDMAKPTQCVPPQFHSTRRLKRGDMMFVEFTATFWDASGQVLRSFTVDAEPTPLFRDLHATAEAAFEAMTGVLQAGVTAQEIVDASGVIEGRRILDLRRHPARLRRRLLAAGARLQEPSRGAGAGHEARGQHDGGGAAQRHHARRKGRGAAGRNGAHHRDRVRAHALAPRGFRRVG